MLIAAACGEEAKKYEMTGLVLAGPTCPVEKDPPDPGCADKPLANALVDILNDDGDVVATVRTMSDGTFSLLLEEGSYRLRPGPAAGMMGPPEPLDILVTRGGIAPGKPTLVYDTGIR